MSKTQGINEMRDKMAKLAAALPKAEVRATNKFGRIELAEMKKITPVDTGELVDSGSYSVTVNGSLIRLMFLFSAHHAAIVHEDLEAFHPRGQAKYVESVLNESGPHFLERVAADVKSDLGL